MKKLTVTGILSILICTIAFAGEIAVPGFDKVELTPGVNISEYDVIHLEDIDLSDVRLGETDLFYDYDNESGGILQEEEEKSDLAYTFRRTFDRHLEKVMPVEWRAVTDNDLKVMTLEVKISGVLREAGIIENLLPGKDEVPSRVAIEGRFVDEATGEEIMYFYSEQSAAGSGGDSAVMYTDDRKDWVRAVDKWAAGLASWIANEKGAMYMDATGRE